MDNGITKVQIVNSNKMNSFALPLPPLMAAGGGPKLQSKIERITAMLVSQNLLGSNNAPAQAAAGGSSDITTGAVAATAPITNLASINYLNANKNDDVSSSSIRNAPPPMMMPNGILKNGSGDASMSSSEHKNISFGKMYV